MTLTIIAKNSSVFTDEKFNTEDIISLANKAINKINIECNTKFSTFKTMAEEYTEMPSDWLMSLISPYLSYGIKMNDTSLSEADRYLEEFNRALISFKGAIGTLVDKFKEGDVENGIDPAFVESEGFGGVYGIDTSGAIDQGWFGNNGNGGGY